MRPSRSARPRGWQALVLLLVLFQGVHSARPVRLLQQQQIQGPDAPKYKWIFKDGNMTSEWESWSWGLQEIEEAEAADAFCMQLDPYGALSLKSQDGFPLSHDLHFGIQVPQNGQEGANSIPALRIQFEGTGANGYAISQSTTLMQALDAHLGPDQSQQIVDNILGGDQVNVTLPLHVFEGGASKNQIGARTYDRITIGRCIDQEQNCDMTPSDMSKSTVFCFSELGLIEKNGGKRRKWF